MVIFRSGTDVTSLLNLFFLFEAMIFKKA